MVRHPLAEARSQADAARTAWPDADDWDYSSLRTQCEALPEYTILAGTSEPFYLYSRLRGMEQARADLDRSA